MTVTAWRSPISMVYSPSHEIVTSLREPRHVSLHVHERRASDPKLRGNHR